jgi:hypothetical protein
VLVAECRDPAASFAGTTYFAGEANWNYFAAPFILARALLVRGLLWVPNWSSMSCNLGIFVYQAAEPVTTLDV